MTSTPDTAEAAPPQVLQNGDAKMTIYRDAPSWDGKRTASLGGFDIKQSQAGSALMTDALSLLKAEGFEAVLGPMDGDTWHAYRSVTQSDGSAPFLLEPVSGPHDVDLLTEAGFERISGYCSARADTEGAIAKRQGGRAGLEIASWDGSDPDAFFGAVYEFSVAGFARNRFYKPISKQAFLAMYTPFVPAMRKELILFARREGGELVGFLFGYPNYAEGLGTKTAILKTYASSVFGAGHLLADTFHRNALDLGLTTTIHALMHEDNIARKRSEKLGGSVFRRYHLFGRTL
ncbi:MAG: hypothetical protein KI785_00905 [Devosiaceae bacterium]|nr:hypothetical protein [Devosiaceae bacterium MH13]